MAEFISALPFKKRDSEIAPPGKPTVNLLPYHNIASGKYKKLEIEYNSKEMAEPTESEIQKAVEIFNNIGIETEIGG